MSSTGNSMNTKSALSSTSITSAFIVSTTCTPPRYHNSSVSETTSQFSETFSSHFSIVTSNFGTSFASDDGAFNSDINSDSKIESHYKASSLVIISSPVLSIKTTSAMLGKSVFESLRNTELTHFQTITMTSAFENSNDKTVSMVYTTVITLDCPISTSNIGESTEIGFASSQENSSTRVANTVTETHFTEVIVPTATKILLPNLTTRAGNYNKRK